MLYYIPLQKFLITKFFSFFSASPINLNQVLAQSSNNSQFNFFYPTIPNVDLWPVRYKITFFSWNLSHWLSHSVNQFEQSKNSVLAIRLKYLVA